MSQASMTASELGARSEDRNEPRVSLLRLYLLRAVYLLIAVGQGSIQAPLLFHHGHWTLMSGVAHCFLAALAILSLVGVRYPLQMLPLLVYELLWKATWLLGIALPLWLAGQFDADTRQSFFEIAPIVVLIPILPWRYLFANFAAKPGERWR
ncbi:MAG TPA: hypothetical protein VGM17_15625 [Rhizomicrobium sp.]